MGLFSVVKDVFGVAKSGASAVVDVVTAGGSLADGKPDVAVAKLRKFAADSSDFLRGVAKLGADLAPWAKEFVDNRFTKTAKSPVLAAAQGVITAMRLTTGSGTPETGEALRDSAQLYDEAIEIYLDAEPRSDRWDGAAAEEYGRRDHDQKDRASLLYSGDDTMRAALMTEAGQVGATRDTLDEWSRYLYDFGLATFAIGLLGPYGRAAQLTLDAGAAATALGVTGNSMWNLVNDASDNAAKVREASDYYRRADHEVVKGLACDPFGQERNRLPTRLNPPIPNQIPSPEPSQEQGPHFTPLGGAPAPGPSSTTPSSPAPAPTAPTRAPAAAAATWTPPAQYVAVSSRAGTGPAPATASTPVRASVSPAKMARSAPSAPPTVVGAQPGQAAQRAPIDQSAAAASEEAAATAISAR